MPTKKIFQKLIRRATQLKEENVIAELNPKELKNNPEKATVEDQEEQLTIQAIGDNVVHSGVDKHFNALRVFPPNTLRYPDFMRTEDFYDVIGCPWLRLKYPTESEAVALNADPNTMQKLPAKFLKKLATFSRIEIVEKVKQITLPTTDRLTNDYLDKMNWKIWEINADEIGKSDHDPMMKQIRKQMSLEIKQH